MSSRTLLFKHLLIATALFLLAASTPAFASSFEKRFRASSVRGGVGTFQLRGLQADQVAGARVRYGRRSWDLSASTLRAAVRRGWLSMRVARRARAARVRAAGKKRPVLVVKTIPTADIFDGPTSPTYETSASFSFTTKDAQAVNCGLDGVYSSCSSPKSYQGLAVGTHTFVVKATNRAGAASDSWSWTILAPAPPPPPVPPPPPAGVALPVPPQAYSPPSGAVGVANGAELASALAATVPRDIVLENGTYTSSSYFRMSAAHRLWARNLGGAVLQAALVFGGNSGPGGGEAHGLAFDISDRTKSWDGNALGSWGDRGIATKIFDSTFEGHYALDTGIELRQVQDAVVQRVVVRHFRRQGVFVSDCCDANWYDNPAQASRITDVDVEGVREVVPGSSDGRAEYGVWIGNGVVNPVERLRIEHAWWSGLWTGSSAHDTTFRDLTIATVDRAGGNAVYDEHQTTRVTFERFNLGPNIAEGFVCEWNYGSGPGACTGSVFQDGTIDSQKAGVFLDLGQVQNTIRRVTFLNQECAAIVDNQGIGNTYLDNVYSGIAPGARQLADYCY
jgi:hypothetical protein